MSDKSKIDRGGFVYACVSDNHKGQRGIARRDWLAGMAMQGIISSALHNDDYLPCKPLATLAYQYADAMIAESKKQ